VCAARGGAHIAERLAAPGAARRPVSTVGSASPGSSAGSRARLLNRGLWHVLPCACHVLHVRQSDVCYATLGRAAACHGHACHERSVFARRQHLRAACREGRPRTPSCAVASVGGIAPAARAAQTLGSGAWATAGRVHSVVEVRCSAGRVLVPASRRHRMCAVQAACAPCARGAKRAACSACLRRARCRLYSAL